MGKAEEQVLEVFVIKGRITALEGDTAAVQSKVLKAEAEMQKTSEARQTFLDDRGFAKDAVTNASDAVMHREDDVRFAQTALEDAKANVEAKEEDAAKFSSEILSNFDNDFAKSSGALDRAIATREALSEKIEAMKQELAEKQEALLEEGINLGFETPRLPKTHTF